MNDAVVDRSELLDADQKITCAKAMSSSFMWRRW